MTTEHIVEIQYALPSPSDYYSLVFAAVLCLANGPTRHPLFTVLAFSTAFTNAT